MLPSEQQRNKNQRLIPLSQDLIHDMLNNEGLEYQTPPGAHYYNSEQNGNKGTCIHHNLRNWKIESQQLNLNSKQSDSNSRQTDPIDSYSDTVAERASSSTSVTESTNLKNLVDILHSVKEINNQNDAEDESNNLIDIMNSMKRLRSQNCDVTSLCCPCFIIDLATIRRLKFDEEEPIRDNTSLLDITYSQEWLDNQKDAETLRTKCGPIRSSYGLHYVRSDSLITKASEQISLVRDHDECNQYRLNHHWVNVMAVNKSETSFLLNRHKLQNFKANSCNTYYTAELKDLKRDREAVASLLATPKCKRNYRNVY